MNKPGSTVLVLCSLLIDIAFAFLFRRQIVMSNSPKGGLIYQLFAWPGVDVYQYRHVIVDVTQYIHVFFVASSVLWAIAVLRRNSVSVLLLGLTVKGLLLVAPVLSGRVMMGE
jgi:hypothetical protein